MKGPFKLREMDVRDKEEVETKSVRRICIQFFNIEMDNDAHS